MTSRRPTWAERTQDAIDDRTAPAPGDRKYVTGPSAAAAERGVLRQEQQDEVAQSWLGLGALTDAQFKGGLAGTLVGGVIGALLFLPLGLIEWGSLGLGWRMLIAAVCGALAGGTALAVYLGGREPELEGETRDVDDRPSIGTTPRDPRTDRRGR